MNPNEIELKNLAKSFEYHKLASEIDNCDDKDESKTTEGVPLRVLYAMVAKLDLPW